jgi:hypothetical protein
VTFSSERQVGVSLHHCVLGSASGSDVTELDSDSGCLSKELPVWHTQHHSQSKALQNGLHFLKMINLNGNVPVEVSEVYLRLI